MTTSRTYFLLHLFPCMESRTNSVSHMKERRRYVASHHSSQISSMKFYFTEGTFTGKLKKMDDVI